MTDEVNHPSHYTHYKGMEIIELTEQMNFNLGNAVKYIARAGLKDPSKEIEDLEKAVFYVIRESKRVHTWTPNHSYGKLPLLLASQMKVNRGSAIKLICLGTTGDLKEAIGYLGMEIEELKNHDLGKS